MSRVPLPAVDELGRDPGRTRELAPEQVPPLLAQLLQDPARVREIPPEQARALLIPISVLVVVLATRAAEAPMDGQGPAWAPAEPDRLLPPGEAACLLGVTPRWLYRHAKHLPFTRRLSRKCLRFSEAGLRRWQVTKKA